MPGSDSERSEYHAGAARGGDLGRISPHQAAAVAEDADKEMFSTYRIGGFKSFEAPSELDLARLTLLCGPNGAGKTSILQPLLLLRQSVATGALLQLNGPLVRLGSVDQLSHAGIALPTTIELSFDTAVDQVLAVEFDSGVGHRVRGRLRLSFSGSPTEAGNARLSVDELSFRGAASTGDPSFELRVRRMNTAVDEQVLPTQETVLSADAYAIELEGRETDPFTTMASIYRESSTQRLAGVELRGPVPVALQQRYQPLVRSVEASLRHLLEEDWDAVAFEVVREDAPEPFAVRGNRDHHSPENDLVMKFFRRRSVVRRLGRTPANGIDLGDLLRQTKRAVRRELRNEIDEFIDEQVVPTAEWSAIENAFLPYWLQLTSRALLRDLGAIRHLGPLRETPRPLYEFSSADDPRDVGARGQFAASVLHDFGQQEVDYFWEGRLIAEPLLAAVNRWLSWFGLRYSIRTTPSRSAGYALWLHDDRTGTDLDATQVGVGFSQLYPILVQTLITPRGGMLLIEQPELHLHPALQSRLADFFVAVGRANRQIICETHSEHFVNRLRILLGERAVKPDYVAIYFVTREDGASRAERISIDSRGRIENWPSGFFDQSAADAARLIEIDLTPE